MKLSSGYKMAIVGLSLSTVSLAGNFFIRRSRPGGIEKPMLWILTFLFLLLVWSVLGFKMFHGGNTQKSTDAQQKDIDAKG